MAEGAGRERRERGDWGRNAEGPSQLDCQELGAEEGIGRCGLHSDGGERASESLGERGTGAGAGEGGGCIDRAGNAAAGKDSVDGGVSEEEDLEGWGRVAREGEGTGCGARGWGEERRRREKRSQRSQKGEERAGERVGEGMQGGRR